MPQCNDGCGVYELTAVLGCMVRADYYQPFLLRVSRDLIS